MTTKTQARDSIGATFKAKVDAYNVANPSATVAVFYDDTEKTPNDGKSSWMRLTVQHGASEQLTLAAVGNRRFERRGAAIVQIFTPFGDGFTLADTLATLARDAFEGVTTANGVWFRKVSPGTEAGKSGTYQQTNVTADFQYTERR